MRCHEAVGGAKASRLSRSNAFLRGKTPDGQETWLAAQDEDSGL